MENKEVIAKEKYERLVYLVGLVWILLMALVVLLGESIMGYVDIATFNQGLILIFVLLIMSPGMAVVLQKYIKKQ